MPRITTADGTEIFVQDWGSGPPVVLIHGWPLNADMWEYQVPALLEAGMRVVAYDRRGFGRSSQPGTGYEYDTLADDLRAVIEGLRLDGAAIVGFSMGGGEVARYMSRHGGAGVSRAVLMSAVTPSLAQSAANPEGVPRAEVEKILDGLAKDRPHFLAAFGKQFFGAGPLSFSISSEMLQWTLMLALQGSSLATRRCVTAFAETDFGADMAAFRVPTLVMHGDGDAIVPIGATGRRAARMIAGARLVEYPGASHAVFYTERERVNADLVGFLRGG
jgi:pimeloyl-ACP methyl ester carboxylesterase